MTQEAKQSPTLDPVAVSRDEGEARWWFGSLAVTRAHGGTDRWADVARGGHRAAWG